MQKIFNEQKSVVNFKESTTAVDLVKDWQSESEGWVGEWEDNQKKWYRLRYRVKNTKNFPFSGCSNLRMPTVDIKLRKVKAALMNVLFGIRPIITVEPEDGVSWGSAKKIEKYLDHCAMDKIGLKEKMSIIIDRSLEKGFYLAKPYWRFETTTRIEELSLEDISMEEATAFFSEQATVEMMRDMILQKVQADLHPMVAFENKQEADRIVLEVLKGKSKVKFTLKDVIYNNPDVAFCSPERVYVPTTSGYDPQNCEFIIHEFFMPLRSIKANVKNKGWNGKEVSKIEIVKDINLDDKTVDVEADTREGIQRLQSSSQNRVRIYECYCNYDINGDGVTEKCVITIAPDFNAELRKITVPFYSGKFPFVKFFYELTDDRWFSHRGIPELIEDIVKEIDIQHMQKIDYGTIANVPLFAYRAGFVNPETTQFVFGQGIPVGGMNAINDVFQPINLQNPNVNYSYEREQMILETKVEELIGQIDFSLQSMINKRQPRTLGEVEMQVQNAQSVFSLDADMYRLQFAELMNWLFELIVQYGDDQYIFNYVNPMTGQPEMVNLTREDIQNKYKIRVRGNDQNTNPSVRQQKASFVLQDTYSALQMGLVSPQAVMNARKRAYQILEVDGADEFLIPPQPRQPVSNIKLSGDDLTEMEQAQVLAQQGIKADVMGRQEKRLAENRQTKFENLLETAKVVE